MVDGYSETLGTVLGGRYRLQAHLGEGAMAQVFEALDDHTGLLVAVKLIRAEVRDRQGFRERFEREVLIASHIDHSCCIKVLDFGTGPEDRPYLVMELLPGISLADLLDRVERLPVERALHIIRQLLAALAACHDAGILHRDVKPENILLTEVGGQRDTVKLLDFGIAKLVGAAAVGHPKLTQVGLILGTPHYIAPEWLSRDDVDGRADLYSATIVLYEMLTSAPPFVQEDRRQLMRAHLRERPARLNERYPQGHFSEVLEDLVLTGLAKEPEGRFKDARAYLRAIADLQGISPTLEEIKPRSVEKTQNLATLPQVQPAKKAEQRRLVPGLVIRESADGESHTLSDGADTVLGVAPDARAASQPRTQTPPDTSHFRAMAQPFAQASDYGSGPHAPPTAIAREDSQPYGGPGVPIRLPTAHSQPVQASRRTALLVLGGGVLLLLVIALAVNAGSGTGESKKVVEPKGPVGIGEPAEVDPVLPNKVAEAVQRWQDAGLEVEGFAIPDGSDGCASGEVSSVEVALCSSGMAPEEVSKWRDPVALGSLELRIERGKGKSYHRTRRKIVELLKD